MPSSRRFLAGLRSLAPIGLLSLFAALAPTPATAQCIFDLPNGSSSYVTTFSAPLVRAFVSCNNPGGNVPNTTALGSVPSCYPAENFDEQAGSPSGGWEYRTGTSYGRVQLRRVNGGANLLGYPPTTRDSSINLKLYRIGKVGTSGPASGSGTLSILLRATFDDFVSGDVTMIDFPLNVPFQLSNSGSVTKTWKMGDLLMQTYTVPRFPDCTSLEVVSIAVKDVNGNIFATGGVKIQ